MVLRREKSEADGGVATSADDCAVVRDEVEGTRNAERLGVAAKLASEPSESSGWEVEAFEMSKAPDIMALLRCVRRAAERRRLGVRRRRRRREPSSTPTCVDYPGHVPGTAQNTSHDVFAPVALCASPPWLSWLERRSHISDVSGPRPRNPEVASSSLAGGTEAFCFCEIVLVT